MDKDKMRPAIMFLAGIYLVYIGGTLIKDVMDARPDNFILFAVLGGVFIITGAYVIISKGKLYMKLQQEEIRLAQEELDASEEVEEDTEMKEALLEENEEEVDTPTDAFEKEVERFIDKLGENQNDE